MIVPGNFRLYFIPFHTSYLYLRNCLLHLCLIEGGKCIFQIVHDALKAVTLHYLPLMAAQQTEGHFKDHPGPLDKNKIWNKKKHRHSKKKKNTNDLNTFPFSLENSIVLIIICVWANTAVVQKIYQRCGTRSWAGTVRRREWGTRALRKGSGRSRAPQSDCTTRGGSRVTVWRAGTSESGMTETVCTGINTHTHI